MGLQLEDVPYIHLAEQWGAGSTEIGINDVVTLNESLSVRRTASSGSTAAILSFII